MPTVFEDSTHRYYFFSNCSDEYPCVEVDRGDLTATFLLAPVKLMQNSGYRDDELRRIESLLFEKQQELLEKWTSLHGGSRAR